MAFIPPQTHHSQGVIPVECIDQFKNYIDHLVRTPLPEADFITRFWQATLPACLEPKLNPKAGKRLTMRFNSFLSKKTPALDAVIEQNPDSLTPTDLDRILHSHLRLHTVPSQKFMDLWIDITISKMSDMDIKWLRMIPDQLARLSIYPGDEWIETWWRVAKPISGQWDIKDGCGVLYRLALLDFLRTAKESGDTNRPSPCRQIAESFLNTLEKNAYHFFPHQVDSRVYFAAIWFGYDFVKDYPIQSEANHSSLLEGQFINSFNNSSIISGQGMVVPSICHRIDVKLEFNRQVFGAEVDGILHFNRVIVDGVESVEYDSSTRFQSWLMKELMPEAKILRVPYFYIDENCQNLPWEEVLGKVDRKAEVGVYAFHGGSLIQPMTHPNGYLFRNQRL